ncbi:MAG: Zn-ribbon domain-containing OB-fold protein [Desulfotomaculaceae bacterium]|nr:Zn-ribbon domain-containing OB-fold protein [Desulfotomaculaceae bacterium]
MGFERFGSKSFTSQAKVSEFVDYLDKGELAYTKCRTCSQAYFPPRADCANCLGNDMEWIAFEGNGKIVTFTHTMYAPTGFEADAPYTIVVVELDGLKVLGRMNKEVPVDTLSVGMPVKVEIVKLPDGQVTYEFLPA